MKTLLKKVLLVFALIALFCTNSFSQSKGNLYQSTETGIKVFVPTGVKVANDESTLFVLQSPTITFSAHPMLTETLTADALAKGINDVANSAGMKIADMEEAEFTSSTLDGSYFIGDNSDGINFLVGALEPKRNDAVDRKSVV